MSTNTARYKTALAIAAAAACVAACLWAGQAAFAQDNPAPPQPDYRSNDGPPPPPPPPEQLTDEYAPPPPPQGEGGFRRGGGRRHRAGGPGDRRQGPPPECPGDGMGPGQGGRFQRPGPPDPDVIFDQMDENGDEMLTRDEFRRFHEQHRPPRPMGPPPGGRGRGRMPAPPAAGETR